MIAWPAKDPAEQLDYSWTVPLDADDAIQTFTAAVTSGTIAKQGTESFEGARCTVFLIGGAPDELATINLVAVTTGGRTFREAAVLPIIDRASAVLSAFRLRYPTFAVVDDGQISYWLAQGGSAVAAWADADKQAGRLAYAAHRMAEQGLGNTAGATPQGVTSFKSGTFSAQLSEQAANRTGLHSTLYGREFIQLARRAFGGPRTAVIPNVPL